MKVTHPLPPVYDCNSRSLLLGTMPSPASRAAGFYYMHRQNRFWSVLSQVTGEALAYKNDGSPVLQKDCSADLAKAIEERQSLALRHNIALWDVLAACDIDGASDSSIKNAVPNDIASLLQKSQIKRVFTTGQTAHRLYTRLVEPHTRLAAVCLPSTSSANAKWTLDLLAEKYAQVLSP